LRKLCVFLGLAAIGYRLNVGALLALFLGAGIADAISMGFGAVISAWLVASYRLGERVASAPWIVAAFGVAGALVFLGKAFSVFSLVFLFTLGFAGMSALFSVLDAVMLLCFLKLAADLKPPREINALPRAGAGS
jgi:hypothetical protein